MSSKLPEQSLSGLGDYIRTHIGIHYPRERGVELENRVSEAAQLLGFSNVEKYVALLLSGQTNQAQLLVLASCLTVGETYFFRDAESYKSLATKVLPEIVAAGQSGEHRVRIWSAGCSSGEEAYSVAMVMSEFPGLRGWQLNVYGTDINQNYLSKANAGIYSDWSFRKFDSAYSKYFISRADGLREVCGEIKAIVEFSSLNLVDEVYPSIFGQPGLVDLVLFRNVLMYFSPSIITKVLSRIKYSLRSGGWLMVSPVEISLVPNAMFRQVFHQQTILHQNDTTVPVVPLVIPDEVMQKPAPKLQGRLPVSLAERFTSEYPLALQYYKAADYGSAIKLLLADKPGAVGMVRNQLLLSRAYANSGQLDQAVSCCQAALRLDPMNAASHYLLGMIYTEHNQAVKAIEAMRKAIFLDADLVVAHLACANLFSQMGMPVKSKVHRRNTLRLLKQYQPGDELPESGGITAGDMLHMVRALPGEEL